MPVFEVFNRINNFIIESVKKKTKKKNKKKQLWLAVPDWTLFSQKYQQISIWNEKLAAGQFLYNSRVSSQYGAYYNVRPEMLTCDRIFQEIFLR